MFWAYKTKIYTKRFTMFTTSCLGCQQFCFISNEAVCPPFTWYEWDSFFNRTFKCFRGISKYHHFRFTSVPGVIHVFVRVSPTTEMDRISLIKPNVDLKYLLTNMPNYLNSGGLMAERKLYMYSVIQTCTVVLQ